MGRRKILICPFTFLFFVGYPKKEHPDLYSNQNDLLIYQIVKWNDKKN